MGENGTYKWYKDNPNDKDWQAVTGDNFAYESKGHGWVALDPYSSHYKDGLDSKSAALQLVDNWYEVTPFQRGVMGETARRTELLNTVNSVRAPDYFSVSGNFLTIGGTLKLDASGTLYGSYDVVPSGLNTDLGSPNILRLGFSYSANASWLLQTEAPQRSELRDFNENWSFDAGYANGPGGGVTYSPTSSGTKFAVNVGGGVGASVSGGYGVRLAQTPLVWRTQPK